MTIVQTNQGPMTRDRYEYRRFWFPSENLRIVLQCDAKVLWRK